MLKEKISCPDCKIAKPVSEYYKDLSAPFGVSWYCKCCKRKRTNFYRERNREHYNYTNRRAYHLRKKNVMSKEREEKVKKLIKVCRRILCYLPRGFNSPGPHGEMSICLDALKEYAEDD